MQVRRTREAHFDTFHPCRVGDLGGVIVSHAAKIAHSTGSGQCGSTSMTPSVDHDDGDDRVEDAPRAGAREHAAEQPSAVGEGEEPDDARDAGARGERPAAVAVRVGDRPEQEHRVEVDVRVQPGEREAREHRGGERRAHRSRAHRCDHGVGCPGPGECPVDRGGPPGRIETSASARDERLAAGLQRPSRREHSVPDEERGAGPTDHIDEPRHRLQHRADARDPDDDEREVAERADRGDGEHVFAADALPQHEHVLRADGDDEREAEAETRERRGEHHGFDVTAERLINPA